MGSVLVVGLPGGGEGELRFEVLASVWARLRGLLGTTMATGRPVALVRCSSIHTVGMRYPIDVALVSRDGEVLDVHRRVPPGRFVSHRRAQLCLERPAGFGPWPVRGERLELTQSDIEQVRKG